MSGLWRKSVKGLRGATPKPGSMTEYIRQQGLLPADEIDAIAASAAEALVRWQEAVAPLQPRPELRTCLELFDKVAEDSMRVPLTPNVYATVGRTELSAV
jgi:hypothetical protein